MKIFPSIFHTRQTLSLHGMTDWHCHILPGVDDGVEKMSDAISILQQYEQIGITEVWLTPHIMEDLPNTTTKLAAQFNDLKNMYKGDISLHLAAENMIDNLFLERLEANDLLPIGKNRNTLLVETSYFNATMQLYDTFSRIQAKGYHPLLAHPERYNYIDSISTYQRIHEMGVHFQINLMSLCGHYGPAVRAKAYALLNKGLVDCIGSDLHRLQHLGIIQSIKMSAKMNRAVRRLISRNDQEHSSEIWMP